MPDQSTTKLLDPEDIEALTKATQSLLSRSFEDLKASAGVQQKDGERFFFPHGIELIDVTVKVNLNDGVEIQVKVAGEKGKAAAQAIPQ